jgi:NodT family efflux transporter outer membrane factor (OMF) lipoprotein
VTHLRLLALSSLVAGTVVLPACAVNPPPTRTEIQDQAGTTTLPLDQPWRASSVPAGGIQDDWLAGFGDAELSALVAEAVANNPDLRMTALRVEQAAVYVRIAQAELRPKVNIFGTGGTNLSGGDLTSALQGGMLGISWEPDLWGRLRYARNAAQEAHASIAADQEFARQSLAANVAKTWFTATQIQLERRVAEAMAEAAQGLIELEVERARVGAGNELDVAVARARRASLEDSVRQLDLAHTQTLRALELLLGRYPAAELVAPRELPALPAGIPAGFPLEMLERRPDIVAAERRVAAAFNRVGEAKAARLPRIVLSASVAAVRSDILELKDDFENPSAGLGARLLAPLYQGGALKAQVEVRTLEQQEALADYARLALRALGDVENALAAAASLAERETLLGLVVDQQRQALEHAETGFRVGSRDQRAVLERQLDLESARLVLLGVQSERLAQRVNLHLALGGSFELPPAVAQAEAPTEDSEQ